MARNKGTKSIPVETLKHKDKRTNIPTEELRDFVAEDEKKPTTMLYPRDPSLDPQLVWKGKDEQDAKDLAVPVVPVYIQEKIHPQVLIEDFRASVGAIHESPLLFADFNGLDFEKMVEFYQHEQNWSNRMILGDSLLVMTSLAEKEGLKGKVQMIYIDPPYGINFGSNWQVSTRKRDVKDGKAEDATRQPEQIRAFRDTWKLGIHSYLAYLRDRLTVARELLTESGSVFVQIGDENVHLVRNVLDEVFGSDNFCALVTFTKATAQSSELLSSASDYLLWYAKNKMQTKSRSLYWAKSAGATGATNYTNIESPDGQSWRPLNIEEKQDLALLPKGWRLFSCDNLMGTRPPTEGDLGAYEFDGVVYNKDKRKCWKTDKAGLDALAKAKRLIGVGNGIYYKRYLDDFAVYPMTTNWPDTASSFMADKIYVVQTTAKVIQRCVLMTTDPGDLVLDPTCGSGTTAYVAEQWGRRWITCDTSRVALALARTRLMTAKFLFYLLSDSPEGIRKEAEIAGRADFDVGAIHESQNVGAIHELPLHDVKKGFVYKRVPHVTLKSIANNPDIKEGMSRAEIDAAIARHADTELLYDQPFEDSRRIRVTGPFTVESLSPHRVLSSEEELPAAVRNAQEAPGLAQFETMILDNLRRAGVQNYEKGTRLRFDRLEPYAGLWIQASGEYTENTPHPSPLPAKRGEGARSAGEGKVRRVAVSLGPERGTVGPDQVKEAAKEAVQGIGFDLLIVCGFAFDPHVSEEAKRYGKLTVLITRINPDLQMGDEPLKKTGAGNLFMVFGEPDIEIRRVGAHRDAPKNVGAIRQSHDVGAIHELPLQVVIKGLDIYDPTTGQIRSHSTDDIASWFIDTNYNGESFFVRHAYFTGAEEPYDKLKRALRAEIDEGAWSALYSTVSRPFDPPKTGKIAVKVINHYGDEVLKVYNMPSA